MRIGLVGCVKSKRSTPTPAKDLYTSTLFVGRRRHVEASCDQWFVLSALYGLVDPDRVVEPYDVTLADQSEDDRRAWARSVVDQLRRRLGTLSGVEFEIHAGAAYRDHGLVDGLRTLGATVELPTEGLNFGQQLAFYWGGQPERSSGRSTYAAFGSYLRGREPPVDLSIDDVSGILGRPLPPSALRYREWWANTDRSPQGRGWLAANWKVASVDLVGRRVMFTSLTPASGRAAMRLAHEAPALSAPLEPQVASVRDLGPFSHRWPDSTEEFDRGWEAQVEVGGARRTLRFGLGRREVFGRDRPHAVVFVDGAPVVEGTATDDYPTARTFVSMVKQGRRDVVEVSDLPSGYAGMDVVVHREVVTGPGARQGLAVRLREDDVAGWGRHALLRLAGKPVLQPRAAGAARGGPRHQAAVAEQSASSPAGSRNLAAVVAAILDHGASLSVRDPGEPVPFTSNPAADRFVSEDPFAFLVAVIADQGIRAERAWAVPFELRRRLGYFSPQTIAASLGDVQKAFATRPALHRLVNTVPRWIHLAAVKVIDEYGGDAGAIWGDKPTATVLGARLREFVGISQKKAAMATEILERDLGVVVRGLGGSDVAFDVHLRRVFLRCGLAERDDLAHMVAVARTARPERPGSLDFPVWDIGRRWCRPTAPLCDLCAIGSVCPRLVAAADGVRGM